MLFKQWNEIAEPRHQLDSPTIFGDYGSLQISPLPKVAINVPNLSNYSRVIVTTAIMNALFPVNLLNMENVGELVSELTLDEDITSEHHSHSWDFNENFPNEVDPEDVIEETNKTLSFTAPIMAFEDTLIISLRENFLKISPIFLNRISEELFKLFQNLEERTSIVILGTSDQISEMKPISNTSCTLQPPEFVTGFVGSVLTQLVAHSMTFDGFIAPSEGPVGFEKLTLETMENLVEACSQWVPVNVLGYADECYRRWRLDGGASGAQSGLYI